MPTADDFLAAITEWHEELPTRGRALPAKGSIAVGLVILERLKDECALEISEHLAGGGAQISGLSGPAVQRILETHGETRPFLEHGGRTNRDGPRVAERLLARLDAAGIGGLPESDRRTVLEQLQGFLAERVRDYFALERLKPVFDPRSSTRHFVRQLLDLARQDGKYGPVAQYLVGAKLQLRFPEIEIRNDVSAAADVPTGQSGDFVVGDTTFHVTVSPTSGHYQKCVSNLKEGRRVYVLVPEERVIGARQNADVEAEGRIAVESIESFVSQNVEELSTFDERSVRHGLRALLELYNQRVDDVESDKSMMIAIPPNLH